MVEHLALPLATVDLELLERVDMAFLPFRSVTDLVHRAELKPGIAFILWGIGAVFSLPMQ